MAHPMRFPIPGDVLVIAFITAVATLLVVFSLTWGVG